MDRFYWITCANDEVEVCRREGVPHKSYKDSAGGFPYAMAFISDDRRQPLFFGQFKTKDAIIAHLLSCGYRAEYMRWCSYDAGILANVLKL